LNILANAAIKVSKVSKGIKKLRGGLKGTPNMKSLNIVRRIRKHTKRGRKKNHFSRNFKGKVIDGVHELYTLTAGMVLGIRGAVSWTANLEDHSLTLDDFSHVDKQVFPAKGNDKGPRTTPPHPLVHTFKFKSYAPKVFARIREFFNIDVASYMMSVCGKFTPLFVY
jgi:1-phosphatidylinositol-4-phosphate 5-kinase